MRNFFMFASMLFIVYACTKTTSINYQPPKAIASSWDTLKQDWIFATGDSSITSNQIDCPELDISMLLYSEIRCFIRGSNGYISPFVGKNILNNIDFGFSLFPFSPTASFNPHVLTNPYIKGKIFLTLSDIPLQYSKRMVGLLNLERKSKVTEFRYIIIPNMSAPNARIQLNSQNIDTMDYHTLCNYLNIKE